MTVEHAPAPVAGSRSHRLASVIIALACIVVAGIAVHITDGISGDVVRTVDVKQPARLDGAIITATGVRVGTRVDLGNDQSYTSKGMILAVTFRVEAPGQKYTIGGLDGVTLHTDDHSYSVFGPNTSITADAGFASTGDMLFEVDPRHIAGAYLEVYQKEIIFVVPQKLHIRLGITDQNADQWAAAAKGRTITTGAAESEPLP
ncbi:MAG: hypothetical protein J2P23_14915 [Microlunatus sp.]|nr:hypothetical protein [Microlunatus sp.]